MNPGRPLVVKFVLRAEPRQINVTDCLTSNSPLANNKFHSTSILLFDLHTISYCLNVISRSSQRTRIYQINANLPVPVSTNVHSNSRLIWLR